MKIDCDPFFSRDHVKSQNLEQERQGKGKSRFLDQVKKSIFVASQSIFNEFENGFQNVQEGASNFDS